jgi:hypothetical protein
MLHHVKRWKSPTFWKTVFIIGVKQSKTYLTLEQYISRHGKPPQKSYLRHKNCEQLDSLPRPFSFHIRSLDSPCVSPTTTQHLQYICHCHLIPLHILLPKVSWSAQTRGFSCSYPRILTVFIGLQLSNIDKDPAGSEAPPPPPQTHRIFSCSDTPQYQERSGSISCGNNQTDKGQLSSSVRTPNDYLHWC